MYSIKKRKREIPAMRRHWTRSCAFKHFTRALRGQTDTRQGPLGADWHKAAMGALAKQLLVLVPVVKVVLVLLIVSLVVVLVIVLVLVVKVQAMAWRSSAQTVSLGFQSPLFGGNRTSSKPFVR